MRKERTGRDACRKEKSVNCFVGGSSPFCVCGISS